MTRLIAISLLLLCGCGVNTNPATYRDKSEHGHSHEFGKILLADVGHYHAGLTAHLSTKTGNELDILIVTIDSPPKPAPLPLEKIFAKAKTADGQVHELVFELAERDERKDDPAGQCSHFTAKAPWMKPGEVLAVTAKIEVHKKEHVAIWNDFNPRQYAHFEE